MFGNNFTFGFITNLHEKVMKVIFVLSAQKEKKKIYKFPVIAPG